MGKHVTAGAKSAVLVALVAGISLLHLTTHGGPYDYEIFFGELYLLPVVLAGWWFGLPGALGASVGVTAFLLPFTLTHWEGFAPQDLDRLLEIALYYGMATVVGVLRGRERRAQEELVRTERLTAMGTAVSAAAHDMKTPLVAISGFTQLVVEKLSPGQPERAHLDVVIQETRRLEKMLDNMMDFSRPLEIDPALGDINGLVRKCLPVVLALAERARVPLTFQPSPDLSPCAFDAVRMEQVLINLIQNAVEASPEGATVTVCTAQKGSSVLIEVVDSGSGIPPEKNEIFRPFVTTKRRGTGLGLPIAKKIVEAHEGRLEILDNPDRGVTVRVTLPAG
jgi:signal transduction histidine kinase